jgi:TatD DNase family protein
LKEFPKHFGLAEKYKLPMYLHNRNTGNDFFEIVGAHRGSFSNAIVHSFTGTEEELHKSLQLDLHVGVNGCSLKTAENMKVAASIPLDRLMLETDAPYCEIRNTHASAPMVQTKFTSVKHEKFKNGVMVKSRNEPCTIIQVLEVMAKLKNIPEETLA